MWEPPSSASRPGAPASDLFFACCFLIFSACAGVPNYFRRAFLGLLVPMLEGQSWPHRTGLVPAVPSAAGLEDAQGLQAREVPLLFQLPSISSQTPRKELVFFLCIAHRKSPQCHLRASFWFCQTTSLPSTQLTPTALVFQSSCLVAGVLGWLLMGSWVFLPSSSEHWVGLVSWCMSWSQEHSIARR